ncbi:MAG: TIGR03619 family F420-dependent LLM class oxidoreductase [Acidimicrobiales bacterium]
MRLGIVTPVVNLNPRFDPPLWEHNGSMGDIVEVSRAAESLGYEWVSCPEHVVIPTEVAAVRGGRYWDPLVTLSYVGAATSRIGLLSHVLVLGYHHPLQVVKRYGTLDVASGGRVILGVGVGTLRPEFELLGASYADRGERADDALRAIRASFGRRAPRYDGPYYRYDEVIVEPCGLDRRLPVWVGGRSRRSLRRALALGDGWVPFGLGLAELAALLGDAELDRARREREEGFEVVLAPEPPLDPLASPGDCADTVRRYEAAGATALSLRFQHRSREHYIEQLQAMAEVVRSVSS